MDYDEDKTMRHIHEVLDVLCERMAGENAESFRPILAEAVANFLLGLAGFEEPHLEFRSGTMVYIGGFPVLAVKIREAGNGKPPSSGDG